MKNLSHWTKALILQGIFFQYTHVFARAKEFQNEQYDLYAQKYSEIFQEQNQNSITAYFRYFDGSLKEKKVLDLGCGDGSDLSQIGKMGAILFGIDASKEMIELATTKNPHANIQLGYFENIPFSENYFDVVISKWALQTSFDIDRIYQEIAKVLKPGGKLIYLTSHPIRQFIEKKKENKNYFKQEIVESVFFDGQITVKEPSHTLNEYLSPTFFRYFSLESYEEGLDAGAEKVNMDTYPSYIIIEASRKSS